MSPGSKVASTSERSGMAKVVVVNHVTLDGVMQAPARREEDTRDGFSHGGWAIPGNDEVMARKMAEGVPRSGLLLLGRRTYEDFYAVWPQRTDSPFSDALTKARKYVVSRTLTEPLPWENSILLSGDAADAVAELKQQLGDDLTIFGSGALVASLIAVDLIDEYLLMIHPLVLGSGRRLFPAGHSVQLRLVDNVATTTGVVIATYQPRDR